MVSMKLDRDDVDFERMSLDDLLSHGKQQTGNLTFYKLAFNAFEDAIYLPSPTRVPLRHGLFAFRCAPEERVDRARQCAERIRRFELSLA